VEELLRELWMIVVWGGEGMRRGEKKGREKKINKAKLIKAKKKARTKHTI